MSGEVMKSVNELLNNVSELKYSIANNDFKADAAYSLLMKMDSDLNNNQFKYFQQRINTIKSFLITFNISCFSDCTILFLSSSDNINIIEYAGNEYIFNDVKILFEQERNFFKDMDRLQFKGDNYRIFFESMETDIGVYTLLTITCSDIFKPTRFHMLADIIMDIIRSADKTENSVFQDLFEGSVIQLNSFINNNTIIEPELYLFVFENINDFFLEVGFEVLIELSQTIKKKILELFGNKSGVFTFSLSKYIVVTPANNLPENKIDELKKAALIEFSYKGIKLHYKCIRVPYDKNNSIYDVIENIYPEIESND